MESCKSAYEDATYGTNGYIDAHNATIKSGGTSHEAHVAGVQTLK